MKVIDVKKMAIEDLLNQVISGKIITDVVYQRVPCWKEEAKADFVSKFIQQGTATQSIYLSQNPTLNKGKSNIHDGLQRITTLKDFKDGKFCINTTSKIKAFFKDLNDEEQDNFINGEIPVISVYYNSIEEEHQGFININIPKPLTKFQVYMGTGEASSLHRTLGTSISFKEIQKKLSLDGAKIENGAMFSIMELALSDNPYFHQQKDLVTNWEGKLKKGRPKKDGDLHELTNHLNEISKLVQKYKSLSKLELFFSEVNIILEGYDFKSTLECLSMAEKKQQSVAFLFFILKLGKFNKSSLEKNIVRISKLFSKGFFTALKSDIITNKETGRKNSAASKVKFYNRINNLVLLFSTNDYFQIDNIIAKDKIEVSNEEE